MNYELYFYLLLAFIAGRLSTRPLFYIGDDPEKYKKAYFAIGLRRKK